MYDAAACRGFRTGRGLVGRGFVAERRRRRRCRAALSLWYSLYTFLFSRLGTLGGKLGARQRYHRQEVWSSALLGVGLNRMCWDRDFTECLFFSL